MITPSATPARRRFRAAGGLDDVPELSWAKGEVLSPLLELQEAPRVGLKFGHSPF